MTGNPPRYEPPSLGLYVLKYRKPVPCDDLLKWGRWIGHTRRHVRHTIIGNTRISTVFLGLDHSFTDEALPILFETMIFPDRDDYQTRCSTWREALKMHWDAVREVEDNG